MALIPPDVGLRMRLQAEASILHPASPVQGIPSDLPELQTGQMFTARIQEVLPENTYRALVAGKSLTLSLPEGAKSGDTLELVVVDRTPKLLLAKLAETGGPTAASEQAYQHATLSPAAQLIGKLLLPQGGKPQPAPLNGGEPLLVGAPDPKTGNIASQLAPRLESAVKQSGLFYEAHQARWIAGKLPAAMLLLEPQGQKSAGVFNGAFSPPLPQSSNPNLPAIDAAAPQTGSSAGKSANALPPHEPQRKESPTGSPERTSFAPLPSAQANVHAAATDSIAQHKESPLAASIAQSVPEELRPLVQQQLEAAATQRMVWHGEVWPEQQMEWEIERDARHPDHAAEDENESWSTRLALASPRLGRVEAALQLNAGGIRIELRAADEATTVKMRSAIAELAGSLEAAGLASPFIQIGHGE